MLILHIIIALASLAVTALAFFLPTRTKLQFSKLLIASTLLSGVYLVFSMQVNLLHVCVMGLVYTAVATCGLVMAHSKLATEKA